MRAPQHGFNLIELMISIVVLGVLIALGAPGFSEWLQNQQIRAAAEATLNGLQVARSEAVARNANVSFQFVSDLTASCATAPLGSGGFLTSISWVVSAGNPAGACDKKIGDTPPGPVIQSRSGAEGTPNAVVTTVPAGTTTVTYTPLGATTSNLDGSLPMKSMTLSNVILSAGTSRPLQIVINPGGSTRMCDPLAVASDTRACPAP
ncbi:MAG TPA: GspH/FimT family pseudopilin [Burkholderiales bacterium]|nr:GspH/FimT family pseudopilin [Burkholderiales bacterium]